MNYVKQNGRIVAVPRQLADGPAADVDAFVAQERAAGRDVEVPAGLSPLDEIAHVERILGERRDAEAAAAQAAIDAAIAAPTAAPQE